MDIKSIFSGSLDAFKSGLKGGISSIPNAFLNQSLGMRSTAHAQNISQDAWREQNSTKYQLMADDLRRAGLNPILAVTGGLRGGGSGPSASPVYSGTGFSSAMDVKRAGFEEKESKAKANLFWEQTWTESERYYNVVAERIQIEVTAELRRLEQDLASGKISIQNEDLFRKKVLNDLVRNIGKGIKGNDNAFYSWATKYVPIVIEGILRESSDRIRKIDVFPHIRRYLKWNFEPIGGK